MLGGRYRLTAQVGRGSTSIVYRGVDEVLGRSVAVKVFDGPRSELNNPERQLAEMHALAAVDHPNLVTVFDAHVADGDDEPTYLILELVAGTTLSALLADGPLPPQRVAEIGVALAGALSAVHAASVVHRDVKPGNVLLTTTGTVKLGDFGLARILDNAAEITTGGEVMGTAAYLSPEQVASAAVLFPSDVYSLGLVLLECLTGHREYDGDPATAALARLLRRPAVPDFLPAPWPQLLTDMTEPDPLRRPTIVSVLAILDAAAEVFPASTVSNPDEATPTDAWSSPLEPYLRAPARSDAVERSSPRRFVLAAAAVAVATAAAVFFTGSNRSSDAIPPTPATAGIPAERVDAPQPAGSAPSTSTSTSPDAVVADPQTTPAPESVAPAAQPASSTSAQPVLDQPAEEQDPDPAPVVAEPVAATQPVPPAVEQPAPSTEQPAAQSPDQPPADTPTASTDAGGSGPGNNGNGNGKDKAADKDKDKSNGNGNGNGGKQKG
jgi:serine/threonine protein kinase